MFTLCKKMGCTALVEPPTVYCDKHRHIEAEQKAERNKLYDRYSRHEEARNFYKSKAWSSIRLFILNRDARLCQECLKNNRITKADTVHHIKELLEVWELRLEPTNLESICKKCHNKHKRKGRGV